MTSEHNESVNHTNAWSSIKYEKLSNITEIYEIHDQCNNLKVWLWNNLYKSYELQHKVQRTIPTLQRGYAYLPR